jgi:hypothetical protein
MADSDFWRELAEKFRAIEDPFDLLHAEWKKFERDEWSLVDEALAARPHRASISTRFEALARRGGTRLDSGRDSLHVWLDALRAEDRWTDHEVHSGLNASGQPVEPPVLIACWIMRLCKSSAEFCDILESRAIESERIAKEENKQQEDPRNWSALHQYWEAHKGIKKLIEGPHERIPEALVREVLARQYSVKPEEVTWEQIRHELTGLFRWYPALTMIPTQPNADTSPREKKGETASEDISISDEIMDANAPQQTADTHDQIAAERAELLAAFKSKARAQGMKVTDAMVAKAAKKTMVTWWKRNDPHCKPVHDRLIRAVLAKDPALLWGAS